MYDVSDIQTSNATLGMTISYHPYISIYMEVEEPFRSMN
jgi:hypothetical protein